jgi:sec-independent protein translocase protein TatB
MFGITADKVIILIVVAAFLIGPSRLPAAAAWLRKTARALKGFTDQAKDRAREELGEDFDAIEWHKLDPRRYDPRRIIADALLESTNVEAQEPQPATPDQSSTSPEMHPHR